MADITAAGAGTGNRIRAALRFILVDVGILPILMILALVIFAYNEPRFLSSSNLFNIGRQSTFLAILALGQLVVIITAGLDLSAGSTVGFSGVVCALVLISLTGGTEGGIVLSSLAAIAAGLASGVLVGLLNGFGIAVLRVSPFMMTLGLSTSLVGVSLALTQGLPVNGVPDAFMWALGYGRFFGLAPQMIATILIAVMMWIMLNRTTIGRYLYAIGANLRSAQLSGITTRSHLIFAYAMSGLLAAVVGVLFVARSGAAEALNGQSFTLQAIAACVIGGVSLFGGIGRVRDVILGAVFITMLTNGMNLIRLESYVQQIVLGIVLITSLVVDQLRIRLLL